MAGLEPATYSIALAIVLLFVYVLQSSHLEKYVEAILLLRTWYENTANQKLQLEGDSQPGLSALDSLVSPRFPRSWWTDERQFQLERRAIFSKAWLFVTHISRFQKAGDYRTFEIAGYSVLLILGKDKQIRAFHNVCRHRAYAVTKKQSGSTTVLGCRYHGWSYDTKGKLIKAPEFDKVPGFDRSVNGLWKLKTEVKEGMVFVNFDARGVSDAILLQAVSSKWKFSNVKFVAEWKVEGGFNWKLLAARIRNRFVKGKDQSFWSTLLPALFGVRQKDFLVSPSTIVRRLKSGTVITLRFSPNSAKSTTVDCCVYTQGRSLQGEIELLKVDIQLEIEQLEIQQRRISLGDLPMSNDSLTRLAGLLEAHRDAEKQFGGEINPAARNQSTTKIGRDDDEFCRELQAEPSFCNANSKGLLDW